MNKTGKRSRIAATRRQVLVVAGFLLASQVTAQDKGVLAYNGDKDAAYLILDGRNDNRAARLSVDGDENLRGFLELHRNGNPRVHLYVDAEGEGGLTLRNDSNDAASLFVDDSSESGVLILRSENGESRVRLFVDDDGQGQLRLEGSGNSERVSLYVDNEDQGGLWLKDDDGDTVATLYVDNDSDTGVLSLKDDNGDTRAFLRVSDSGRGLLSLDGSDDQEKIRLYVDDQQQGGVTVRGSSNEIAANLYVDDSSDTGVLVLKDGTGDTRAYLRVNDQGRGTLSLDGDDSVARAELYADVVNQGGLQIRGTDASTRAEIWVGNTSDAGRLRLYNGAGELTVELNGETGVISKSGMNGFLIEHPRNSREEIFYASLEGPEAGMYVRGSGKLQDGFARIELPEHFLAVARKDTMTVQVTPTSIDTTGLAVTRKHDAGFEVRELIGGPGQTTFDYHVIAERGDIDQLTVVRPRTYPRVEQITDRGRTNPADRGPTIERPTLDTTLTPIQLREDALKTLSPARLKQLRDGDKSSERTFIRDPVLKLPDDREPVARPGRRDGGGEDL